MATTTTISRREYLLGATATLLGTLSARSVRAAEPAELAVIVHSTNGAKLTSDDLVFVFKTSMRHWPGGGRIAAFNLPPRSSERVLFDRVILGLDPDAAARFWIDRKIRGGEPPPRIAPDPLTVLRVVEQLEGAIGYVPTALATNKVRVVAKVRHGGVERATHVERATLGFQDGDP